MAKKNEGKNSANSANDGAVKPYKNVEFEIFLKEIGNANLPNWSILAEALGVDRDTIASWRNHPLAKQALSNAIEENLREMTIDGKGDWRMRREKLKMLGVKDKTTLEHEAGETFETVLGNLHKTDYGDIARKLNKRRDDSQPQGQSVEVNPPVQSQEQAGGVSDVPAQPDPTQTPH